MPFKFFQSRDEDGDRVPNDCELQTTQQQAIEKAGYTDVDMHSGQLPTATDADGNRGKVPTEVYYDDSTASGGDQ